MRILFVNDQYDPSRSEGSRAHIEGLCENLGGFEYEVWSLPGSNNPHSHKLSSNPLVRLRQVAGMDVSYVRVCWRLPRYRYIREPFRSLMGRKPIVWEVNSTAEQAAHTRGELVADGIPVEERYRQRQAGRVALAICNTDGLADYARRLGVRNAVTIPLGADPGRFHPAVEPLENVARVPSRLNVMWCGSTQHWWHDFSTVLRAAESLRDDGGCQFYLVGDVPSDMPRPANMTHLGRLPNELMPRCLASMDVGLVLYRTRGKDYCMGVSHPKDVLSPIKLFEYMASGLVAVASPLQQVKDCIIREGENGYTVGFGDPAGLVRTLRHIQTHRSEMRSIREAAVATVTGYFNWERVAAETVRALSLTVGLTRKQAEE